MSPQAALESHVFCFYASIVGWLLIASGIVIALLKWGLHKDVDHAWRAYCGWLLLVPLAFGCLFLGRGVTVAFLTLFAVAGFKEFARATGLDRDWMMTVTVYAGIVATGVLSVLEDPTDGKPGCY